MNTNWSNPENWAGDVAPSADDDLVFPAGATVTSSVNDFVGESFGSLLIEGDNYDLSGEAIILNGSITVGGAGNSIGMDLTLGLSAGFATTGSGTVQFDGAVDLNGNDLSVSNSGGGGVELNSSISGTGGVSFSGNGTAVLAAANSYTGETLVSGGTLVVQDPLSLGTTDGTAATGTRVINGSSLLLENSITVVNELLTSDDARVISDGDNVWTGPMTDVGSDYLYLLGANSTSSLRVDGDVTPYYLEVRTGNVVLNGADNSSLYTYVQAGGDLEVNGDYNAYYTYIYSGGTLETNSAYTNLYETRVYSGGMLVVNDSYSNINRYTRVYGGATLEVNGTYTHGSSVSYPAYIAGVLNVNSGGTYSSTSNTLIQSSGTVTGSGTVNAGLSGSVYRLRVQSGGTIDAGTTSGPGVLATSDLLFEHANSNFDVQINGTTAGIGYDQVQVTGNVILEGKLNLSVGYTPAIGDSFTIIENDGTDAISGSFSGLAEGSLFPVGSDYFRISYQGGSDNNDVVLTVVEVGIWDGAPDGGAASANAAWSNPDNWVGDLAPTSNANLIFPSGALQTTNTNDFVGETFGSILIQGDNYNLSGEPLALTGSVTNQGANTSLGFDMTLGSTTGLANSSNTTLTMEGAVDLNGNDLLVSNTGGGGVEFGGSISGSGGLSVSGNGTTVLAVANSYTGETLVSGGTLVVQDALSLGTTDGTAGTGTRVINGSSLRLENSITVVNELLTSDDARVFSKGDNVWTGSMTDVGSDYLYLWGADSTSSLRVDGNVTPYYLDVRTGEVFLNGTTNSSIYTFVRSAGRLEINSPYTAYYTYVEHNSTLEANSTYSNLYDTRVYTGASLIVNGSYTNSYSNTLIYSGGTLDVTGTYTNSSSTSYGVYVIGTLNLANDATLSSTGFTYVQSNGKVTGSGTLNAGTFGSGYQLRVQSGATIDPGTTSEPGILATGDLLFENANSNFTVRIDGTSAGTGYDQVQVEGTVVLDGRLNLSVGYTPAIGDSFTIIENDGTDAISGSFSGLAEGSLFQIGSDYFLISYQGGSDNNDVVLTVVEVGIWDGAPDGGTSSANAAWSNPDNWVGDVAPSSNANLIFPSGALQTTNTNDFVDATFGSILIEGNNYDLSGEALTLNGSVTNQGANTRLGFDVTLGSNTGLANSSYTTLTIVGAVDLNGNDLLVSNSGSGGVEFTSSISGAGGLSISGNGTTVLAVANSYTGETLVSGGTLVVQDALSLGTADGTAGTGTRVINGSSLRLENSITVVNELLTSDDARVFSKGDNVWTGSMTDVGSDYLYLWGADSTSSLRVDGDVTPDYLDVRTGEVSLNGTTNSTFYTYVRSAGRLEINAAYATYYTYVDYNSTLEANSTYSNVYDTRVYGGGTLVVNGSYANSNRYTQINNGATLEVNGTYTHGGPSYPAQIYGTLQVASGGKYSSAGHTYVQSNGVVTGSGTVDAGTNSTVYQLRVQSGATIDPGPTTGPGILATGDLLFESSSSNFDVQLNGNTPGTGYDQLQVDGVASIAGNLNVTLLTSFANVGDEFTILNNVSNNPTTGTFNGLPESGLVKYAGNIWSISYRGGDGNDVVLRTQTINKFPIGTPQNVTTNEETPVSITLSGNDTDGVVVSYAIETLPLHGTLSGTAPNLVYTPFTDYAGPDSFQFRVTDDDEGFGIATVYIDVKPVQDAPTQVTLSESAIDENSAIGTAIGTLGTVDPDVGDTFIYTLVTGGGDSDNGLFTITDDQLQLGFEPDFESDSSYSVRIRSTDAAGDWVERAFTISVNDVNEAPTALTLTGSAVDENVAVDTVVGTFGTSDPDAGDSHTYRLVSGEGADDNGAFYINGNQLRLRTSPDLKLRAPTASA